MPDLTPNGMTLPLLVAAAVAGALHWYTSRKPAATPPEMPAAEAAPLDWLTGLFSKAKSLQTILPVLVAIWNNHDKILSAVQAFISSIKQMMTPPTQPPAKGA